MIDILKEVCIEKVYSVSALVGNGDCNANCDFCSGKYLREEAKNESPRHFSQLETAIKLSARYGGWSLSLTSSGETTCDPDAVTKALEVYKKCADQGAFFPNANLFTNGIKFADEDFCREYLDRWRELGLTNIALSIHDVYEHGQARAYNLKKYPDFKQIIGNIRKHALGVRGTLLLRKGGVDNPTRYAGAIDTLTNHLEIDNITSWPVGNPDGSRNSYTPSKVGLWGIQRWLRKNAIMCHGHVWGGGVFDYKGSLVRITDYVTKHDPKKDYVRQLVVFQNGTIAYSWIREGGLCMK